MFTTPGSTARDTTSTFRQFPHRDEKAMADIEGMKAPGWSNSQHTEDTAEAEEKVVASGSVEDKTVTAPAKKTASKSTPRKG